MTQLTIRERYEEFQAFVRNQKTKTILEKPLSRWTHENDKHLPQKQLSLSMIGLSEISFDELLKIQGIGERKIEKLIELVERVIAKIENDVKSDELDFTEILNLKEEKDLYLSDSILSQYPLSDEERWEKAITFIKVPSGEAHGPKRAAT